MNANNNTQQNATPSVPNEWAFFQVFGEESHDDDVHEEIQNADLLSALDFDEHGNYLATGDRGGRIVIFDLEPATPSRTADGASLHAANGANGALNNNAPGADANSKLSFRFLTEFQSHEPEFDCLKSIEIDEKINSIKWLRGSMGCKMLVSTNDKTIKLWRIHGKKIKAVTRATVAGADGNSLAHLRLPQVTTCEHVVTATPKRIYSNAHAYHINTLALNSDGESFLSCDDLRLNLWKFDSAMRCFTLVDIKPPNMDSLSQVMTSADFHPHNCNTFIFSTSRGSVHMGDMRAAALCDGSMKTFQEPEEPNKHSFISEIIASISNANFSPDGRYIVTRDYLTVRVWDVNMESRPLKTFNVQERLRPRLIELYEKECIFDKFEASMSHDGSTIVTGAYQNQFHMLSMDDTRPSTLLEASQTPTKVSSNAICGDAGFSRRVLHAAFHPSQRLIAVAATCTLSIFRS